MKNLARELLQRGGASGFSFQDLADRLKVRKASLHHHFRSKDELLVDLLVEAREDFEIWAVGIAELPLAERWAAYLKIFRRYAFDEKCLCPGGALAPQVPDLSKPVQKALTELRHAHRDWLVRTYKMAQADGGAKGFSLGEWVSLAGSTLMGALQLARMENDPSVYDRAAKGLTKILLP